MSTFPRQFDIGFVATPAYFVTDVEPMGRVSGMLKLSLRSIATSLGIQLLNVAGGVMLARLLGPSLRGELTAILFWPVLLAMVGSLAVNESATFFAARERGRERPITGTSLLISIVLAAVVAGLGYLLLPAVIGHYGTAALTASRVYLFYIPIYLLWMTANGVLLGKQVLGPFNSSRLAAPILITLGIAPLLALHKQSLGVLVAVYLTANLATLSYVLVVLARKQWLSIWASRDLIRPLVTYSLRAQLGNVARTANDLASTAIISVMLPAASLGYFAIAMSTTAPVAAVGTAVALMALPATASATSITDKIVRLEPFVRGTLTLSAITALGLILTVPDLIPALFGRAFLPAAPVAQILLIRTAIVCTTRVLGAGLAGFNRPLAGGFGESVAFVLTAVGTVIVVPTFGITGAALVSLGSNVVGLIVNMEVFLQARILRRGLFVPTWRDVRAILTVFKRQSSRI